MGLHCARKQVLRSHTAVLKPHLHVVVAGAEVGAWVVMLQHWHHGTDVKANDGAVRRRCPGRCCTRQQSVFVQSRCGGREPVEAFTWLRLWKQVCTALGTQPGHKLLRVGSVLSLRVMLLTIWQGSAAQTRTWSCAQGA